LTGNQLERRWGSSEDGFETYKRLHGDLYVVRFVVPSDDSEWPEEVWGMARGLYQQYSKWWSITRIARQNCFRDGLDYGNQLGGSGRK
jgi:hypothetical protein